ncbi:MAG: beta-L-arabinofuranosidase domain-containing protein [Bacteroidota bacterium]
MYKIKVLLAMACLLVCFIADDSCAQKVTPAVKDVLSPGINVRLSGYLADKLSGDLNNRVLAQDVDRLVDAFKPEKRTEEHLWQTEFWGKWFTSAVLAYKYKPDAKLRAVLDHAVTGLLANQTKDGYIGNYAEAHRLEEWDIWGRKYCMLGLLAYYDIAKDKKSLTAATRLADNLINELKKKDGIIVTKGNYRGMAASSVLEPICLLYNQTGNKKYLDFALEIVRQWETPEGPQLISKANTNVGQRFAKPKNWYSPEQGQKAYEMMSCYEGLLELYRITGNETYKKTVEDTWENIRKTEINIAGSGASTEMWFGGKAVENIPVNHYQETCVTVTWLKLSSQLLRLTGEAKYADEAEKTYYNALLASLSHNGAAWAKYTPLNGQRLPGSEQCGMGLNCCEASGPRGLFLYPLQMVMQTATGLQINHFTEGVNVLKSPKGQLLNLVEVTRYPKSGVIEFTIDIKNSEDFEMSIRIPAWSLNNKLTINNQPVADVKPGTYAKIRRTWKINDKITLELDMRGRVVSTGITPFSKAIIKGPIVLARDARFENADLSAIVTPYADKNGYINLTEVSNNTGDDILMLYKATFVPEAYTERGAPGVSITLCDYASAGNGDKSSFFQVWMTQLIKPAER